VAMFHLHVQVISRASGVKGERSVVACAAYRAGEKIKDLRIGEEFDYTRRKGVDETMILSPEGSPEWTKDRGQLWNQVEAAEIRKDAQLAREMDIAFPVELTEVQRRELIKGFVQEQFVAKGMVADVAIHQGVGKFSENPHAHVMLTMREIHEEGFGNKVREWNDRAMLGGWREQWARAANRELERAGLEERIDHRKLEVQKEEALEKGQYERAIELDRAPTRHKGVGVTNLERRGLQSEVLLRMKKERNKELIPYRAERKELTKLVQELRGVQDELSKKPELTEVQRHAEERRRQEEQRKAREEQEFTLARTDRKVFDTLYARIDGQVDSAFNSCWKEVRETIEARQKPQREQLESLRSTYRDLGEQQQWFGRESKKVVNRLLYKKEIEDNLSTLAEGRKQITKEYNELDEKLKKELSPENVDPKVIEQVKMRYPGLIEQHRRINLIREEWKQPHREVQKELTKQVQEPRGMLGEPSKEPQYQKITPEEERKARVQRELELARTNRPMFEVIFAQVNREWDQACKASEGPLLKAIIERQKPQIERLDAMVLESKREWQQRLFLEKESKKAVNVFRRDHFAGEIDASNNRRLEIDRTIRELDGQLIGERIPYSLQMEAPRFVKTTHPELYERREALRAIHLEWLKKDHELGQKKVRGREGPDLGLEPGKKRGRDGPELGM